MENEKIYQDILNEMNAKNLEIGILPIEFLDKVKTRYENYNKNHIIHEEVNKSYLLDFQYDGSKILPNPKSIFLVSTFSPPWEIKFQWKGKTYPTIIPPTYLFGKHTDDEALNILSTILHPHGYRVEISTIPKKLLAAFSGLVKYGRNNVTYTEKYGSYHRLTGYLSDFPYPNKSSYELELMEQCNNCQACRNNCPTHAISEDRFVIRAEKCLTFLNEKESEIEFPEWINPSWHNCLVGCMRCQIVCPINKKVLKKIEIGPTFTEVETKELLTNKSIEGLSEDLVTKMKEYDILYLYEVIPRNLRTILNQ